MTEYHLGDICNILRQNFEIYSDKKRKTEIFGHGFERFSASAYKQEYSFLKKGLKDFYLIKTDHTLVPEVQLYNKQDIFIKTRKVSYDSTQNVCRSGLNDLEKISFRNCYFEPILGYLLGSDKSDYDLMIHLYSKGLELFPFSNAAPLKLRHNISDIAAKAIAELHSKGMIYSEAVPTNMRFDYNNKLIFNPHQHIEFNSTDDSKRIEEIALFIKTNCWIPNIDKFLKEYNKERGRFIKPIKSLKTEVLFNLEKNGFGSGYGQVVDHSWIQY